MTDPRWTPEIEDQFAFLVVKALAAVSGEQTLTEADWTDRDDHEARAEIVAAFRPVLAALAEAGLLLPLDTKTAEEYGYRVEPDGGVEQCEDPGCRNSHSHRRTVWTGPWTEVQP